MAYYPPTPHTLYHVRQPQRYTLAMRSPTYPPTTLLLYPCPPQTLIQIPELLCYILAYLDHETFHLKQCALVNSTWLSFVRPRLFERVVIQTEETLRDIFVAFEECEWLVSYVKEVAFGPANNIRRVALENCEARSLRRLKNVRTIHWTGMDWDALAAKPENRDALLTLFGRVQSLWVTKVYRSRSQIIDLLGAFPSLQHLHLGRVMAWPEVRSNSSPLTLRAHHHDLVPPQRPQLRRLSLEWDVQLMTSTWADVLDVLDFSAIQEVRTEHCASQVTEFMRNLCTAGRESLEKVNIAVDFKHLVHWALAAWDYTLTSATRLRHLCVSAKIATFDIQAAPWLARVLSSVQSEMLDTVEYRLDFATTDYFGPEQWSIIVSSIEEKLQKRSIHARKIQISFELVGLDEERPREIAQRAFEGLVRQGVVSLCISETESSYACWPGCDLRFRNLPN